VRPRKEPDNLDGLPANLETPWTMDGRWTILAKNDATPPRGKIFIEMRERMKSVGAFRETHLSASAASNWFRALAWEQAKGKPFTSSFSLLAFSVDRSGQAASWPPYKYAEGAANILGSIECLGRPSSPQRRAGDRALRRRPSARDVSSSRRRPHDYVLNHSVLADSAKALTATSVETIQNNA
jgi:hypothetical protein